MNGLRTLLEHGVRTLEEANIEGARRDAKLLLLEATGLELADLIINDTGPVGSQAEMVFRDFLAKRCDHWPVGKIIGHTEFYGYKFIVTKDVLEPRADSETVIDTVLAWTSARHKADEPLSVLDMCTGSGCLGLTLCAQNTLMRCVGADIDLEALDVANKNAVVLGLADRFMTLPSDMFDGLHRPYCETAYYPQPLFDVIVCNPPYIKTSVIDDLSPEVRNHDPHHALDGGENGLLFYNTLIEEAPDVLRSGGALVLEIGFDQADQVTELFRARPAFSTISVKQDLAGNDRVILAECR